MKDSELDWFRPMWRRVLVAGLVAAWFLYELVMSHDQLWMLITGGALTYVVWHLFIRYDKRIEERNAEGSDVEPRG